MPVCRAALRAREWRFIILSPSTITLSSSGRARRTFPFFPLSLPAIMTTVSSLLIFTSQHLGSQGYYLGKVLVSEFPGYRTKNTAALRIILVTKNDCGVFIKSNIGAIGAAIGISHTHHHSMHYLTLFHHSMRYGSLHRRYNNVTYMSILPCPDRDIDTHNLLSSGIICYLQSGISLNHLSHFGLVSTIFSVDTISVTRHLFSFDKGRVSTILTLSPILQA